MWWSIISISMYWGQNSSFDSCWALKIDETKHQLTNQCTYYCYYMFYKPSLCLCNSPRTMQISMFNKTEVRNPYTFVDFSWFQLIWPHLRFVLASIFLHKRRYTPSRYIFIQQESPRFKAILLLTRHLSHPASVVDPTF